MTVKIKFGPKPTIDEKNELTKITGWGSAHPIFEFICKYAGAEPENNFFMSHGEMYSIHGFTSINAALFEAPEGFAKNAYPLAFDEGGNYFYILYGGEEVWFWDHEIEDGDLIIAKDVNEFIINLKPYVFDGVVPAGTVVINLDPDWKPEFD